MATKSDQILTGDQSCQFRAEVLLQIDAADHPRGFYHIDKLE
jgi:hypothetical protein